MKPINYALRQARKIPLAPTYKDKCKAVHMWHKAVSTMLKDGK